MPGAPVVLQLFISLRQITVLRQEAQPLPSPTQEEARGRAVLGTNGLEPALTPSTGCLFPGLQPGTEYKITVVPMRGDLEGKPILLNGRTGKNHVEALGMYLMVAL